MDEQEQQKLELSEKIDNAVKQEVTKQTAPRNRAERRAEAKRNRSGYRKDKKMYLDTISDAAKRMAYIELIQRLRKLNAEKEKENISDEQAN